MTTNQNITIAPLAPSMRPQEFKDYINEKFSIAKGHERAFYQCKVCKTIAYLDYVPYSLGGNVVSTNCGHSFKSSYEII